MEIFQYRIHSINFSKIRIANKTPENVSIQKIPKFFVEFEQNSEILTKFLWNF